MKKKILITTAIVVLLGMTFFVGRVSVTNPVIVETPENFAPNAERLSTTDDLGDFDSSTCEEDADMTTTTPKEVLIGNMTINDYCVACYFLSEEGTEPDSISLIIPTKIDDNIVDISMTIPNIPPNLYVWDGEKLFPAEIKVTTIFRAGKNNQQQKIQKWVFTTSDDEEYIIEKNSES